MSLGSRLVLLALIAVAVGAPTAPRTVEVWLTLPDRSQLLAPQPAIALHDGAPPPGAILVDPAQRFQTMVGYGAAITDASAHVIQRLPPAQRQALLAELFGREGIGLSFTRLTIGASDFSQAHYSYDDRPKGERDPRLRHFSIAPAEAEVLPTLRAARAINPRLTVMVSPWSPPGWMKTSDALITGTLRDDSYPAFVAYFVRTLNAFTAAVGPVQYLSLQNEPDFEPADYPGMRMSAAQRARGIALLGPAIARARLGTRILEWDHNWDQPEQPLAVLTDARAARHIAGVAWHCYKGDIAAQSLVRDRHPDKDVFFSECSGDDWSKAWPDSWEWTMRTLMIGAPRHWARGVLLWNLALDEKSGPHLGGCGNCRGVVTINSRTGAVIRNPEYYALGHVSRFVAPGARRIASNSVAGAIETVAFRNPDGALIVVAFNAATRAIPLTIASGEHHLRYTLAPGAAATFRWRPLP